MTETSTRREFGRGCGRRWPSGAFCGASGGRAGGRNLNEKLNIAGIGVGGRGGRLRPQVGRLGEHRRALRRLRGGRRQRRARPLAGEDLPRLPPALRPGQRVRRRRRQHLRVLHPRLRDLARPPTGQARLLREAADAERLGSPGDPPGRRAGQSRDPDGHPDPRRGQLPAGRRAGPVRGDRPGHRGARLGQPRLGTAVGGGREEIRRHRVRPRTPPRRAAGARAGGSRLGPLARPRARPAVSQRLFPGSEMVPLVGLWQRHDERPGKPLGRPAVLGLEARCAEVDRGVRAAAAPGDRAGLDARGL